MLQRVEAQTAQHVGGSLQALSSMDKRVGQVCHNITGETKSLITTLHYNKR